MAVFTLAVVTMEDGLQVTHINVVTEHVSGMGTNGGVTLTRHILTDSRRLSQKVGNVKINGQDKGAVVQRSYRPKTLISIPVIKLKKTLIIVCSTTIIQGINAALQKN